jgi:hypothetical protein
MAEDLAAESESFAHHVFETPEQERLSPKLGSQILRQARDGALCLVLTNDRL